MRFILATSALLAASACDRGPPPLPAVEVDGAVVTLPAVAGRPGAAYFTLRTGNDPMRLVAITSPMVKRIELHETREEGGVSKMTPIQDRSFPPGGELEFRSGGRHAMLFGIDPTLRPGGNIPLTFTFDPAPAVTVEAQVRAAGDYGGH
jgi:copper(I)-binding protein